MHTSLEPIRTSSRTVLCFGDSLTWGYVPGSAAGRLPFPQRWPGVVQAALGPEVRIVEEALNGRTTAWDDAFYAGRNGRAVLPQLLESHSPLDLVAIMLGTNDVQPYRRLTASEVARGCGALVDLVRFGPPDPRGVAPVVLLVAPPVIREPRGWMAEVFAGAEEQSRRLAPAYKELAANRGCRFFDANAVVRVSEEDGVHLNAAGQQGLGSALAPIIRGLLTGAE